MWRWVLDIRPALGRIATQWMADLGAGEPVSPARAVSGMLGQLGSLWQLAALLAAMVGVGWPVGRWLAPGLRSAPRAVLALLAGFGAGSLIAQGLAFAGVADARVFLPAVVVAVSLGSVRTIRARAWRMWAPAGPGEGGPAVAGGISLAAAWAVSRLPDAFEDALSYHLAAPEQWLALRRIVAEPQNVAWHFMLGSEALTMPLLAAGGVVGAKLLTVAAGCALYPAVRALAVSAGASGRGAAWAAALATTAAFVPAAAWGVKNDLLAAVLATGAAWGCMDLRRGSRSLTGAAWWLLGSAIAVKTTAGLLAPALAAMLLSPGSRVTFGLRTAGAALLAALPPAGWALRNWLHLGNPAYPFLSGLFPTLWWGPGYLEGVALTQRAFGSEGAFAASYIPVMPRALLLDPSFGSPALAAALGVVLVAGAPGLRAALLAGFAAWALSHRFARYLAPFAPLVAAAAGPALGRLPAGPRVAWSLVALLVVPPLFAAVASAPPPAWRAWTGQLAADELLAGRYTTWERVRARANHMPLPGRILLTGDERRQGFRARVISAVGPCQPVLWRLSRDARDAGRMRIGLRQLGVGAIVHNYVAAEFRALHWYRPHAWTARQLATYTAFARGWLQPVYMPDVTDYSNGAWIIYAITPSRGTARHPVWFLPQTEGRWQPMRRLLSGGGRPADALAMARAVAAATPGVRQDEYLEGYALIGAGRFVEAERRLRPGAGEGFTGNGNLDAYAGALASLGRLDEAIRWQARSCRRLRVDDAMAALGQYLESRARHHRAPAGNWRGALQDAEAAAFAAPGRWEPWADAAVYAARLERYGEALARVRRALALVPEHPGLAGMVRELEARAHTTISR